MDGLERLVAYTCWANRAWADFVHAHAAHDEYLAMVVSHVHLAEQVWFQRVYGEETRGDVFSTLPEAELRAIAATSKKRYAELLDSDRDRTVAYRKLNGEPQESQVLDILNHLVTHGSHHRGQMAAHASRNGLTPPDTSYITYARTRKLT